MFTKTQTEDPGLQEAIDLIFTRMKDTSLDTKEFAMLAEQLEKLYKIKAANAPKPVSFDTLLPVIGNLVGIGAILHHEKVNVISSKALGFVTKSKV